MASAGPIEVWGAVHPSGSWKILAFINLMESEKLALLRLTPSNASL